MSDTHLQHRKKTSGPAFLIAFLAIGLAAVVIAGMSKMRDRDATIASLQTDLAQAKAEHTKLQGQLAESMNRSDTLRQQIEAGQVATKDVQGQFDQTKAELATLQQQLSEAKTAGTTFQTQLEEANTGTAALQKQVEDAKASSTRVQAELTQMRTELETAQTQLKEANDRAASLELRAVRAETDLANAQKPAKRR
jgi:chromosome segregation protein